MVLVEAKLHEFATEMTDIVITALKIDGSALMLAIWIALTNGENLVLPPLAEDKFVLSEGTMRPRMNRDIT